MIADDILEVLLRTGRGMNATEIAEHLRRDSTVARAVPGDVSGHFIQKVRAECRVLHEAGKIQKDESQLFHNTGVHWIHTFHAACRYVGNYRVDLGGKARQAAMHQYAPRKEHSGLLNIDVLATQLNLLWAEVLDLRGQLPKQVK